MYILTPLFLGGGGVEVEHMGVSAFLAPRYILCFRDNKIGFLGF